MKREIRLIVEEQKKQNDRIVASARIEYPRFGHHTLWFSIPREAGVTLASSANPFVVAGFMLAMSQGKDLHVEGEASPRLLHHLEKVQDYYASAWPAFYRKINVTADRLVEEEAKSNGALVAFSGGMDACYTLLRHVRHIGEGPFYNIRGAVMAHGLDIPLADRNGFARALADSRKITASLGVPLFEVATNMRELPIVWEHVYGPAMAAVLQAFSNDYGCGVFASSHQVKGNILGSHPDIDPLLSSESFQIVHDSAYIHKLDKAAVLKDWPEAMKYLRVCWEGRDHAVNCGRCEKCIRTILLFRANGMFPPCFARDVVDDEVRRMKIMNVNLNGTYLPMLALLKERGVTGSWVDALAENVVRHQQHPYRKPKDRLPPALVLRLYQAQARWRDMTRIFT